MRKLFCRILICLCTAVLFWTMTLIKDKQTIREELIRFHVVANSDTEADQSVKLLVRDAVLNSIREDLGKISDIEEAKAYLRENLPKIENISNKTLELAGFDERAMVTLCKEAFDTREYDTFSLPAGIYESLRIVIGEGKGHNWWCVTFPGLCIPATSAAFEDTAVGAGFSKEVTGALSGKKQYQVRFFLLDVIGKIETELFAQ